MLASLLLDHLSLKGGLMSFVLVLKLNVQLFDVFEAGNTDKGRRLSTVDPLINLACFVRKENNIFNIKMS
jgi:hypothetical protein